MSQAEKHFKNRFLVIQLVSLVAIDNKKKQFKIHTQHML